MIEYISSRTIKIVAYRIRSELCSFTAKKHLPAAKKSAKKADLSRFSQPPLETNNPQTHPDEYYRFQNNEDPNIDLFISHPYSGRPDL
jgi:hypothetical protein